MTGCLGSNHDCVAMGTQCPSLGLFPPLESGHVTRLLQFSGASTKTTYSFELSPSGHRYPMYR